MRTEFIGEEQIAARKYWVDEISKLSGDFGTDSEKVERELSEEIAEKGVGSLLGHLRLCGAIPERYGHDSSEEKLYSKYTDVVVSKSFEALGLTSIVLTERADTADVECVAGGFSFVADAKAFRMSRTAKNQKDFKVEAMDGWKRGKPYAMVACPIYQLPSKTSQIYQQAANRSVCIFSYTHLAVLVRYANAAPDKKAIELLHDVFETVDALNPSKDSTAYWQAVNRRVTGFDGAVRQIWSEEKTASSDSIALAKEEALTHFASERERYMRFSREEAIEEIIKASKIEGKERVVQSVADRGLLEIE